jgi:hypothetical protein
MICGEVHSPITGIALNWLPSYGFRRLLLRVDFNSLTRPGVQDYNHVNVGLSMDGNKMPSMTQLVVFN